MEKNKWKDMALLIGEAVERNKEILVSSFVIFSKYRV
jgi:hypothetical protein